MRVTFFGSRVMADVIKLRWGHTGQVGLVQWLVSLHEEGDLDTRDAGRVPCTDRSKEKLRSCKPRGAWDGQLPPEGRRGTNRLLQGSPGEPALLPFACGPLTPAVREHISVVLWNPAYGLYHRSPEKRTHFPTTKNSIMDPNKLISKHPTENAPLTQRQWEQWLFSGSEFWKLKWVTIAPWVILKPLYQLSFRMQ